MQDVNATIVRGCKIVMPACNCDQIRNNKNDPIWGPNGELCFALIYVNDFNAIGIKATLLAYKITILIIVISLQDLIFSTDRNWGITCTGSTKTDWS
jgi:hypothetical protein